MRKCTFFVTISLLISIFLPITAEAVNFNPQLDIKSESAYLVNLDTNTIVYSKNENSLMSPASLTKIMTAGLLLEHFKNDIDTMSKTYVTAPYEAFNELYGTGASNADIQPNERINYKDLLYAMVIKSGCESANIIAYYLGGNNIQAFIKMMNDKAKELGCTNTNFSNAHGLYDEQQRTSARDMAIITEWAMSMSNFNQVISTKEYVMEATDKHPQQRAIQHTMFSMLDSRSSYYYKYSKGGKTGTLNESGQCLVSVAEKDGYKYLLVTMNAPIDATKTMYNFIDHKKIFEWAFSKLSVKSLLNDPKKEVGKVQVEFGKDASYVLVRPEKDYSALWSSDVSIDAIKQVVLKEDSIVAPVKEGQKLGVLELQYNGQTITKIDLVATKSVGRNDFKYYLEVAKLFPKSTQFKIALFVSLGILLLYSIWYFVTYYNKKRRRTFATRRRK